MAATRGAAIVFTSLAMLLPAPRSLAAQSAPTGTVRTPARAEIPPTVSPAAFDHSAFDRLLRAHVVNGLVDYDAFAQSPEFPRYLAALAAANEATMDEDERLAFWINVYNAGTIALINAHHEHQSIRNIDRTFGVLQLKGPWNERTIRAAGRTLSLDEVEHRILRRQFHEPRIHFAIVAAAKGSPPLRSEAYTGARLEAQLEDQGRRFLRESPDRNDFSDRIPRLSPIFEAYRDDFGTSRQEVGAFISHWLDAPQRKLVEQGIYGIHRRPFDWSLNRLPPAR